MKAVFQSHLEEPLVFDHRGMRGGNTDSRQRKQCEIRCGGKKTWHANGEW